MKLDFCQKNLGKHEDVRFGADYSVGTVTNEDLVGFDLCVLGTGDHTIFTYGTFGMWGALLAGGDVITSKGRVRRDWKNRLLIYL